MSSDNAQNCDYFFDRLDFVRNEIGLKKGELMNILGVSRNTYASYQDGRSPNVDGICKFCLKFNVDGHWLLTGQGQAFLPGHEPAQPLASQAQRVEFLRASFFKDSYSEFARLFGVSRQFMSNIKTGRSKLPFDLAKKIADHFDVNEQWLLFGKGNMREGEEGVRNPESVRNPDARLQLEQGKIELLQEKLISAFEKIEALKTENQALLLELGDIKLKAELDRISQSSAADPPARKRNPNG